MAGRLHTHPHPHRAHLNMPRRMPLHALPLFVQPQEVYVDDESKLTLHGLVQHYVMLHEEEKNRKLNDLLDALDFNQVGGCAAGAVGLWWHCWRTCGARSPQRMLFAWSRLWAERPRLPGAGGMRQLDLCQAL